MQDILILNRVDEYKQTLSPGEVSQLLELPGKSVKAQLLCIPSLPHCLLSFLSSVLGPPLNPLRTLLSSCAPPEALTWAVEDLRG